MKKFTAVLTFIAVVLLGLLLSGVAEAQPIDHQGPACRATSGVVLSIEEHAMAVVLLESGATVRMSILCLPDEAIAGTVFVRGTAVADVRTSYLALCRTRKPRRHLGWPDGATAR